MPRSTSAQQHPPSSDAAGHRRGHADGLSPTAVDCVVRSDALEKAGGDTVQVREYARHLSGWGFDIREVPFHPQMRLREGAVVHIFNVDRPFEFLMAYRAARGRRIVVSPIHHEITRVRAMRSRDAGRGLVSLSARVLPEAVREWLATGYRAVRGSTSAGGKLRSAVAVLQLAPLIPSVWRAAGRRLDDADVVALLAAGEGRDLRRLTGWSAPNDRLIPNGRPDDLDLALRVPWEDRAPGSILVVGRIEPRKRQLELARAATGLGIGVRFVGPFADEDSAYAVAFKSIVAQGVVRYDGAMRRHDVLALLGVSRVLINASWVEVQSLVDLEAAAMGCAVVTSPTGHSREWLGDAVTSEDGDDLEGLLRRAAALAGADAGAPADVRYDRTWRDAAVELERAFRD